MGQLEEIMSPAVCATVFGGGAGGGSMCVCVCVGGGRGSIRARSSLSHY